MQAGTVSVLDGHGVSKVAHVSPGSEKTAAVDGGGGSMLCY